MGGCRRFAFLASDDCSLKQGRLGAKHLIKAMQVHHTAQIQTLVLCMFSLGHDNVLPVIA